MLPTDILRHERRHPTAAQAFSEEDQAALAVDLGRVEREEIGVGVHEHYEELARALAGGRPAPQAGGQSRSVNDRPDN